MYQIEKGNCYKLIKTIPDNSIDLILTDPPYEYVSGGKGNTSLCASTIKLKESIKDFSDGFDYAIFNEFLRVQKVPNMMIFCSNNQVADICKWFQDKKLLTTILIWCKTNPIPMCKGNYLSDLEFCIYVHGAGATFNQETPFDYKRKAYVAPMVNSNIKVHPAQKPQELLTRYIALHSNKGDTVLDCFMGGGSTGVACIKLDRNFIGFEITDKYFDIAKARIDTEASKQSTKLF